MAINGNQWQSVAISGKHRHHLDRLAALAAQLQRRRRAAARCLDLPFVSGRLGRLWSKPDAEEELGVTRGHQA